MTQLFSGEARLALNAPYFSRLAEEQVRRLSELHLGGRVVESRRDLILALYAEGKLQDLDRAQHLINLFLPLDPFDWEWMKNYSMVCDTALYDAIKADPRVTSAIAANRAELRAVRAGGAMHAVRAPPPGTQ